MKRSSAPVFTYRQNFLNLLGIDIEDVPWVGYTDDYVDVIGAFPDRGDVIEQPNDVVKTRIYWWNDAIKRGAIAAKMRDFDIVNGVSHPDSDTATD